MPGTVFQHTNNIHALENLQSALGLVEKAKIDKTLRKRRSPGKENKKKDISQKREDGKGEDLQGSYI